MTLCLIFYHVIGIQWSYIYRKFVFTGNIGSANSTSPDYGFVNPPQTLGVKEAATYLVTAIENNTSPPTPDPLIAKTILKWLQVRFYYNGSK